jgi:hypothetical protein
MARLIDRLSQGNPMTNIYSENDRGQITYREMNEAAEFRLITPALL